MKIDIPSPTPEEQDGANPPLRAGHATQTIALPKTTWKPRVSLMVEVDELLTWGMTEDYNHEPEHSTMEKELATEADISPPPKREVTALPGPPTATNSKKQKPPIQRPSARMQPRSHSTA